MRNIPAAQVDLFAITAALSAHGLWDLSDTLYDGPAQPAPRAALLLQVGVVCCHLLGLVDLQLTIQFLQLILVQVKRKREERIKGIREGIGMSEQRKNHREQLVGEELLLRTRRASLGRREGAGGNENTGQVYARPHIVKYTQGFLCVSL